ncbi:MAG TPA: hypothetical protein VF621_08435 [Pyrinomonadaceae bacterium]
MLCMLCATTPPSAAQSGRRQQPSDPAGDAPASSRPRRAGKQEPALPDSFIVVTAFPDDTRQDNSQTSFTPPPGLESEARGACVLELRRTPGMKVVEDEDVARWEAREAALAESRTWVVWMELRWDKTVTTYDPTPFRLRYLLFEPGTGRIAASGVGRGVRQTWGRPQMRPASLEEQVRQAGRNVAEQVLSELRRDQ